jgi:hypothetical protein
MYPTVDCQGTITISAANINHVVHTIEELSSMGVDVGLNFIHTDTGGFDFFPSQESIKNLLLNYLDTGNHRLRLYSLRKYLLHGKHRVQNAQDTVELIDMFLDCKDVGSRNTCWHCHGDPYGGPSIDADGSLRCCGYRKGTRTSKLSVFDLATDKGVSDWRAAVEADCAECPGCTWSYPRLYKRYKDDPSFGKQVFVNHAQIHDGKVTRMNERDVQ